MAKYLLLKHYGHTPEDGSCSAPMTEWTPAEINAHIAFQIQVGDELRASGEFVDAQALAPESASVRYGGEGAPPVVTDGPFPETKELVAGWYLIDVESKERAYEVAAYVSSAPAQGGKPLYERIEVRPLLGSAPASDD